MQISNHRTPLMFKGIAVDGQEPDAVKNGRLDSHTFKYNGSTYRVWEKELKILERANVQYGRDTLTRSYTGRVPEGYGTVLEPTRNKKMLNAAEEQLRAVYKTLVEPLFKQ